MTNQSWMEAREAYFDRYRRLLERQQAVADEHDKIRTEMRSKLDAIEDQYRRNDRELSQMRSVISSMIEKGLDPTEAKLRDEPATKPIWRDDIWTNHEPSIDTLGAMGPIGTIGNLGAVGAAGPFGSLTISSIDGYSNDSKVSGSYDGSYASALLSFNKPKGYTTGYQDSDDYGS